jgi:hypothetical protein
VIILKVTPTKGQIGNWGVELEPWEKKRSFLSSSTGNVTDDLPLPVFGSEQGE